MQGEGYKQCSRCGETKPLAEYYFRKDRGTHRGTCKACMADDRTPERMARNRETTRQWQRENIEHRRAYAKANWDKVLAATQKWRDANREAVRASDRERYAADPARHIARTRAWVKANPEKAREMWWRDSRKRQIAKRNQFVEHVDRRVVWQRDEGKCGICGQSADPARFHVDHIVPLSQGGLHSYDNVQVAHPACNIRKGAKAP